MYVISNNCAGSFIYKLRHIPFNIPTTWARSSYSAIKEIYNKFKTGESLKLQDVYLRKSVLNDNRYVVGVFNGFELHYSHYLYRDEPLHSLETEEARGDVIGRTILEYVWEHINKRLSRDRGSDKPIFILDCSHQNPNVREITVKDIEDFISWDDTSIVRVLVTKSMRRYLRYKDSKDVLVIFSKRGRPRHTAHLVMEALGL